MPVDYIIAKLFPQALLQAVLEYEYPTMIIMG